MNIAKIVATRCHILQLKCIKFDFGWGSAPDPAGGSLQRSPRPLAGFKGPYFYGEGRGREGREGRGRGRGRGEGRGGAGEGRDPCFWVTPPEIES